MSNLRQSNGILYIVATPIGHLHDITLRALETLQAVDKVIAEDTRHSKQLLQHYSIQKAMISVHEFNERARVSTILTSLKQGESLALLSDAGTPLISDPGWHLLQAVIAAGIKVIPIPGPCAAITALSVAGMATHAFVFIGFLPNKSSACRRYLLQFQQSKQTVILYESPRRLLASLHCLVEVFGRDRKGVVARELTKLYESVIRGTLQDIVTHYTQHPEQQCGELVVLIEGQSDRDHPAQAEEITINIKHLLTELSSTLSLKQSVDMAVKLTRISRNDLYRTALQLNQNKRNDITE